MITAQDINTLRQQTGAGMMACKKALTEAQGNFDAAIELLRKKGQKMAADRAHKTTTAGTAFVQANATHNHGVLLTLACETDFVAKNAAFQQLGQAMLKAALAHQPPSSQALLQLTTDGQPLQDHLTELIGKMGEKITLSTYQTLHSHTVVPYLHTGSQLGVLVALQGPQSPQVIAAGRDVAMQIAAMNPLAVDKTNIPQETIDKELTIAKELASSQGKPEALLDKIAQGRLQKFFQENTLLRQPFVKDNTQTIAQYLQSTAPGLTVTSFVRCVV